MHVSQTINMIHRDASFHRVCESLCAHGIGFTWFTECMYASQTLSMIHRDALFHRVCESLCVHGSHVGLIYRYYLFHRVHVWFTDIEHDSQRCFVLQSLLLFRRVLFHRVRVCFTDFTDMTLVRLMCGQCVSKSIVVSQCLPTVHRVCQKNGSQSLANRCLQCFISSIEFCFTEFAF